MSRVFSPEAIGLGQVPEPGAHTKAAQFLLGSLFDTTIPGIDSGLVYGSTTFGADSAPNSRSDVDILISYDAVHANTALPRIKGVLHEAEQIYKTPVEAIVLPNTALGSLDQYGIDSLMLRHLLHTQRERPEWQRGSPLPDNPAGSPPDRAAAITIAGTYCNSKV
jgi:predicted nucleotidyltransferase